MSASPALAPDAAIVVGIASTALPFACTAEDAAERWLRILRLHGEAGATLQALGVSEGSLRGSVATGRVPENARASSSEKARASSSSTGERESDALALVLEKAIACAGRRHAAGVATPDLLRAVMDVYGEDFERVLRAHGTDGDEVLERLAAHAA